MVAETTSYEELAGDQREHLSADDFCVKLQTRINQDVTSSTKHSVLVLNGTEPCKHRIYYHSDHVPPSLGKGSTSLKELLSPPNGQPIGNIPQIYRLRMARSLVIAVLQFYATPWLTDSWQSNNLLFNNVNPEDWQSNIPSPHLVVRVAASNQPARLAVLTRSSLSLAPTVPNLMLFNLGVMLLELAYGVPFRSLLQSAIVDVLADDRLADFNAAYRLANNVGVYFGSGYADIVWKCLRCDFGEGEGLDKPALQERLYEDVICRLEGMENGIRKLQGEI